MRVIALFALTASLAAQLPPEIMADRYLLQAERAIEREDFGAAQAALDQISLIGPTDSLALPEPFYFRMAQVAKQAGQHARAVQYVTQYLTIAGREGKFYGEALELLVEAEAETFSVARTCAGKPKGAACWMALTSHPGCYVWNGSLADGATASWSGECADGLAHGTGRIAWEWESGKYEETGSLWGGKSVGDWTVRHPNGAVSKGPYENGERHGQWSIQWADDDGELTGGGIQGPYVNGKRHGQWVARWPDGAIQESPYVDGERHGQLTGHNVEGATWEISYANGKRHGLTIRRFANGAVKSEGPYVDDKQHGKWTEYFGKEPRWSREGPYLNGERHGQWITRRNDGRVVFERQYDKGKLHGPYVERNEEGRVTERGQYKDWEKHGEWIIDYEGDGRVDEKGAYVEGEEHGRWTEVESRDSHDRHAERARVVLEGEYELGERVGRWTERFDDGCVGTGGYAKREKPEDYGKGGYSEREYYNTWLRHGYWEVRVASVGNELNRTAEGSYVYGERHGQWKITWSNDRVDEGRNENGERVGRWFFRWPSGTVWEGTYENGKQHGEWVRRNREGGRIKERHQWRNGRSVN